MSGKVPPDHPELIAAKKQLQERTKPLVERSQKFQKNLKRIADQFRWPQMTPLQKTAWKHRCDYFERWKAANADPENLSDAAVIYRGLSTRLNLVQLEDIGRRLRDPRAKLGRHKGSGNVENDDDFFALMDSYVVAGEHKAAAVRMVHNDLDRPGDLTRDQIDYRVRIFNKRTGKK